MDDGVEGWLGLDHGVESVRGGDVRDNAKIEGFTGFWEVFEDLIRFRLRPYDGTDRGRGFKEE